MQKDRVTAGDSVRFTIAGGDYPASAGWALTYTLVPRAGGAVVSFAATADGDDFVVALATVDTAAWAAGKYAWFRRVEKAGERYTTDSGELTVDPNPENLSAGFDGRSQAQKALEDLKAARASWTGRVASYQIAGRMMTYRTSADIDRDIRYWENEVAREQRREGKAAGGGRFYVRATR